MPINLAKKCIVEGYATIELTGDTLATSGNVER